MTRQSSSAVIEIFCHSSLILLHMTLHGAKSLWLIVELISKIMKQISVSRFMYRLTGCKFRFLGYANEVGEAFRSLVPKSIVWFSYALSSGYVLADTVHKGIKVYQVLQEFKFNWMEIIVGRLTALVIIGGCYATENQKRSVVHVGYFDMAGIRISDSSWFYHKQDLRGSSVRSKKKYKSRLEEAMDLYAYRFGVHSLHNTSYRPCCGEGNGC